MNKPAVMRRVMILSAVTCGAATFLFAVARQFAVAEIAASTVTGVRLYLLSPTVVDLD
jgi:hypothetical protein